MLLPAVLAISMGLSIQSAFGQKIDGVKGAESSRYDGAVAVWYGSHYEDSAKHDWEPIKNWNGPYHPVLGEYKTDDRKIVRQHLQWLRRAGVDVLFYDVCRIQPELTLLQLPKQKTLQVLAEALSNQDNESRKLKLVVWMEKWNSNPTAEEYRFGMEYVRQNLAARDFYFQFDGKPLVVTYLNSPAAAIDEIDKEFSQYFTLRRISPMPDTKNAWRYIGPAGDKECMTANPGADAYMEAAFIEKFIHGKEIDEKALREHGKVVVEQRAGGKLFETQLLKAREVDPKLIFISGWNDWVFNLQIEPAKEYGFLYVDMAARLLGREAETAAYRDP
jgi:hypothetical protein